MADASAYNTMLASIRSEYSDYVVAISSDFKNNGLSTPEQHAKLVQLNMLTVCMDVFGAYDATATSHSFTAAEMAVWLNKANQILVTNHYIDFSQYYS